MKISKPILLSLILSGIACASLLYYWYYYSSHYISTDNAYVESKLYPVSSRMMGYVREVLVHENETVQTGQKLLKLDDSDSKLELTFKQAKLKKTKADADRAARLKKQNAVSESDIEMAQAALVGVNAEVEGGLLKLKFTEVVSPVDGIVAKASTEPGQFVQPGQSLFVIVPLNQTWIKASFKESQIRHITTGQNVEIHVDAYPGETWKGKVEFIYPSSVASLSLIPPENTTGNFTKVVQRFPVKISFEQRTDLLLRPGMSVDVTIITP